MFTFLQFIIEADYYSTPSKQYYSWYDHPTHGVLVKKGAHAHHSLAIEHGFGDKRNITSDNSIPRGYFSVDKKKKKSELHHYGWTANPTTPNLGQHLRKTAKVPAHYSHEENGERAW